GATTAAKTPALPPIGASPHRRYAIRRNFVQYANFARLAERILVLAEILLGHLVDVLVGAVLSDLRHGSLHLKMAIGIIRIDQHYRHAWVAAHIAVLDAAFGRIDNHVLAVEIDPHRSHLGLAIRHQGGQTGEYLLVEEVPEIFRNCGWHDRLLQANYTTIGGAI